MTPNETPSTPVIRTFRSLSDPEKIFYAPPLPAMLLNTATLVSTLTLVLFANYTPLVLFLVAGSHALACVIGFREPQASNLVIAFLNSRSLPSRLMP